MLIISCWLSHFQGGLEAFPSPLFSSAGNQNSPVYVLNLLGGEGNHFQLRGGNDSIRLLTDSVHKGPHSECLQAKTRGLEKPKRRKERGLAYKKNLVS